MPDIVAFQGIHGANSEIAIHQKYGDTVDTLPCTDLAHLFNSLVTGQANYALLPVENAFAGSVTGAYELLMDYDFRIQSEVVLHVHHALMCLPHVGLEDIKYVRSHPQALAQCERFLLRYNLEAVNWYDTAGAAKDLAAEQPENTAAIAARPAADLYGLKVLAEEIEDVQFNYTRFFVLGNEDSIRSDFNKTSVVFATRNRPSALYDCLGDFAKRNINITKIESRPRRNRPWEPVFYLDFEGHWQDPICQEALTSLLQKASFVKMLGSYPASQSNSVGI